jgi:hypothetical protein
LGTNTIQTDQTCVIRGLVLNGGAAFASPNIGSATVIGLEATIGAAAILDNVTAINCSIGFVANGLQFCTFRNCKAYYCSVGFFNIPQVSANAGGNNSNSYYDIQGVQCIIGFMFALPPPDSQIDGVGNNILYNPSMEECACCGYAFIGQSPAGTLQATNYPQGNIISFDIIEGAVESTGQDLTGFTNYTFAYGGHNYTVPNIASVYISYANITMRSFACVEHPSGTGATNWGGITPIQVLNNSSLYLENSLGNPSVPNGGFILADGTSQVIVDGSFIAAGLAYINGVSSNDAKLNGFGSSVFVGATKKYASSIPNNTLNPAYGDSTSAPGATGAVVPAADGTVVFQATFTATTAGGVFGPCLQLGGSPTSAAIGVIAYDVVSSVARTYTAGWQANRSNCDIAFTANVPVRVYHVFPNFVADYANYVLVPRAGTSGTLSISNVHSYYSATDDKNSRSIINEIIRGAFNNKMILTGYGAPTGLVAPNGAMYLNNNGGISTRLYIYDPPSNTWNPVAGV